jgi:tetratricopeptide (TPR) repeat protein
MHHSIATALERADAPLPAWKLGALGHHWAAAGVGERARGCFLIAARAAKDRTARREAERLYRACIAVEGPPSVALADAYAGLGVDVYWALGRPADALPELERGLAIARAVGDVACEARIRSSLGLVAWSLGDFDGALAAQEAAAAAARSVGDAPAEARALVQLGVVLQARTRLGPAREALERAIALCRDAQDPRCEAQARLNLGTVLADGGDLPGAQAALWGAVELCRAVGERRLEGSALNNLAAVALLGGDYPEAAAASERALRIHRELGYPRSELIALNNLALAKNQLGDLDGARACARQALSLDVPSPPRRATCQAEIADIERRCGDYAAATALLDAAEPVLAAIGDRVNLAIVHHQRALLALATGADPSPFLDTLRASLAELGETAGGSRIAALLARVRRAVASPARLHGEAVSDLPLPLRPIQESPS